MSALATILWFVSYGSIAAYLAAVVAWGMRRWRLALVLSRMVVLVGLVLVSLAIMASRQLVVAASPSERTVLLSQGVSEVANRAAPGLIASILGIIPWVIARRRLRAAERPATDPKGGSHG
jgi:hypothetical protein